MRKPSKARHTHCAQGRKYSNLPNDFKGADRLMDPADTTILLGKFTIETGFFEIFESRLNDILPYLVEGVAYTPVELVGEDMWADITILGQRQAVLCLKHMTTLPGSQLRQVEFSGSDLSTFELRATEEAEA